ncbi:NUDIX domain-containing protein [Phosphitispora sp. TUW77]|uniref:NUDIX domain-containing protein n=1 Tax=Phosphitispora sp. TUW77 TaxID=3152361 RepID=UPI003AB4868E
MNEKTVDSKTIYEGKILNLRVDTVTLPNGKPAKREVVVHQGAVAVAAVNENDEIILIKQFRYPAGKILWELPAGKIDSGEIPQECAIRELAEETGMGAREWQHMATFYTTPGFSDEIMHVYFARNLYPDRREMDEDEFLEIHLVPFENAIEMIKSGEIEDSKSIAGILLVSLKTKP